MKFCPNCGAPIEEDHKFCANCGQKLSPPTAMPKEPAYTDDPKLTGDPMLNTPPSFDPPAPKEEKVPELTLEPDLWGLGASAAAAVQAAPQPEPEPAAPAQAPSFASVVEDVPYENPLREEREQQTNELPNDYTMAPKPEQEQAIPDETLMLVWSIILTGLCSVCGLVGLVKTIKARKAPWAEKARLLNSAKVWLIVGTVFRVLGFIGTMF